ncbi:MAG: hypothetical protein Q7T51_04400 [Candidatus Moranbacteria bacterium]|nr:hypothetical protein [Candidatus Moranbacteria bacterium]
MKQIMVVWAILATLFVPIMAQAFTTAGEVAVKSSGVAEGYWATADEMKSFKREESHKISKLQKDLSALAKKQAATDEGVAKLDTRVKGVEDGLANHIKSDEDYRAATDSALDELRAEDATLNTGVTEAKANASEAKNNASSSIVWLGWLALLVLVGFVYIGLATVMGWKPFHKH